MSAGPASRVRFQIALVVAWLIRPASSAVRACTCSRQCPAATRAALTSPSAAATSATHGFAGVVGTGIASRSPPGALAEAEGPTCVPDAGVLAGESVLPLSPNRLKATKLTTTSARVPAASHKTGMLDFDFDRRARDIEGPSLDRAIRIEILPPPCRRRKPHTSCWRRYAGALRAQLRRPVRSGPCRRRRLASSGATSRNRHSPFVPPGEIACDRLVAACAQGYAAVAALGGRGRQSSRVRCCFVSDHAVTRSAVAGTSGRAGWARPVELGPVGVTASLAVLAATRPGSDGPHPISALTDATRVVGYTGITLFIGTLAFWLLVWPSGRHDRGLIGVAWLGLTLTAISGLAGLASALAAADVGADVGAMLDRPATPLLARVLLSAAAIPWLVRYTGGRATSNAPGVVMMLALALTVVTARPGPLPVPTVALTELHVLAAAGWVGGLAALAVAVVP